jgi:hypothetical protein
MACVGEPRRERLLVRTTFERIAETFLASAHNVSVSEVNERAQDPLYRSCLVRLGFRFEVPTEIGDQFFNSPFGYRACFYSSVARGIEANRLIIDGLEDRLVDAVQSRRTDFSDALCRAVLRDYDAKVWIYEPKRPRSNMDEIGNLTWSAAAVGTPRNARAILGIEAPACTWFEVKTAYWCEKTDDIVGNPMKRQALRAQHIHAYGYS